MLTHHINFLLATFLLFLFISPVQAENHHSEDHGKDHHEEESHKESHDTGSEAHVHGAAEMLIVLDGQELQIELHSPAINLLGFEHSAKNAEQEAKIESLKLTLAGANDLFQINPAACQLSDQEVDLGQFAANNETHSDENHEAEEDEEDTPHSDIEAQYRYNCVRPGTIRSLTTTIPDVFPSIESLDVQWIINGRQVGRRSA